MPKAAACPDQTGKFPRPLYLGSNTATPWCIGQGMGEKQDSALEEEEPLSLSVLSLCLRRGHPRVADTGGVGHP